MKQRHDSPGHPYRSVPVGGYVIRSNGSPFPIGDENARFDRQTAISETGCLEWIGTRNAAGYGQFYINKKRGTVLAHRYSYERIRGVIPTGLVLDHLCRNPKCVNPDHLEAVTQYENQRRGVHRNQFSDITHCKRGHPLSGKDLYVYRGKQRHCRACQRIRETKTRENLRNASPKKPCACGCGELTAATFIEKHNFKIKKTHCIRGHEMSGDNLYFHKNIRQCRACNTERNKMYSLKRRERNL